MWSIIPFHWFFSLSVIKISGMLHTLQETVPYSSKLAYTCGIGMGTRLSLQNGPGTRLWLRTEMFHSAKHSLLIHHRSLRGMGIRLVSLANSHIHLNGDKGTASTIHALEVADIRWLGLNSKQHEIVMTGGQKVGFLAFCGVYGECIESSSFPFAPLRYSAVTATGAVGELKEVSV